MAGSGSKGGGQVQPMGGGTGQNVFQGGSGVLPDMQIMPQAQSGGAGSMAAPQPNPTATPKPQPGFNVNTAASTGLKNALAGTTAALGGPLNVGAFLNPYTQNVVDTTQADIERQRQMAINNMGAAATRANAFGGSRQGVAEGVTNAEFGRVAANTLAPLRAGAYDTAVSNAMADRTARLGAANQLGNLANLGFGMGRTINQDLLSQGLLQQLLQQQLIDAAKGDFAGYTGSPAASLTPTIAALGATPVPKTETTRSKPGILDILGVFAAL